MKVFLSSTYIDLIEYRKVVTIALKKQGHDVLQMEAFAARQEEPTEAALSELGKSDIVVGIYAYRYGAIPNGMDISITEREYEHAKAKGKPVFCFVIDENFPWPPKLIEREPTIVEKLNRFRKKILDEKTVDFFTTPDNLASQVVAAIGRYTQQLVEPPSFRPSSNFPIFGSYGSSLPHQSEFFGREEELEKIIKAISPKSRTWGVLIDGPGGMGKTALAVQAAHKVQDGLFTHKFFITAKERELTDTGEKSTGIFRPDYLSMLNELAIGLGENSILQLTPEERQKALHLALENQRALIIFDNLESFDEEERNRLFDFLSLLPIGNKAIVTSRRKDDIDARAIRLDRLKESDGIELISELLKNNPLLKTTTELEKRNLYKSSGGNPLIIKWIVGQLGHQGSKLKSINDALEYLKQSPRSNNPLEYIFGDLLSTLEDDEKSVLAALTHLTQPINLHWISIMTKQSEYFVEMVIDKLASRSILMVNKKNRYFHLPSLTSRFIRSRLPNEINITGNHLKEFSLEIASQFGGNKNPDNLKIIAENWPAILASIPQFLRDDNNDIQKLTELLDSFLSSSGLWDEWLWLNQQAERKAMLNGDYFNAGMRAYKIGLIFSYRGQSKEVLEYADRAEKVWTNSRRSKVFLDEKPFVDYLKGVGYKLGKNYPMAIQSITSALEIWQIVDNESIDVSITFNSLGEAQMENGNIAEAELSFNKALEIAQKNSYQEGVAVYTGNLAEVALRRNEWAKAENLAGDALKIADEIGQQDEIGLENYRLAVSFMKQDYPKKAKQHARKAAEIFTRLRHKDQGSAQELYLTLIDQKN